jgi:hypothetical protein
MSKSELAIKMYNALKRIAKGYQTPDQLRRNCDKQYGLGFEESLEMAYENLQQEAKDGIKGIRVVTLTKPEKTHKSKVSQKQIDQWKAKAEKWDALGEKIASFYPDEEDGTGEAEGGDLCDIGEAAAMAFGWL